MQNGNARFKIRRLNIGDKPPFEARPQSVFYIGYFLGRAIGRENKLFVGLAHIVESVEQLFLRTGFFGYKLDVVNHKYIDATVFFAECSRSAV